MSATYEIAPLFLIRIAGVPFDAVDGIATTSTAAAVRELIFTQDNLERTKTAAIDLLGRRDTGFTRETFHELRRAVRNNRPLKIESNAPLELSDYGRALMAAEHAGQRLDEILARDLEKSRLALLATSRRFLPAYLIFGAGSAQQLLNSLETDLSPRNKRARERERHLLLYLQRVAAKNDTFSEFGPSSWGRIDPAIAGVVIAPEPGIAKRDAFFERWTAHAVANVINADRQGSDLQVPALEPYAFDVLRKQIEGWAPGPARDKWLSTLQPIAQLPKKFIAASETDDRQTILAEARSRLHELGATS